jgi:hypothetical protein
VAVHWQENRDEVSGVGEALRGENPNSGTPFRLQALVTNSALSRHKYRKGKLAVFMDEIYRDWVLPKIAEEIVKEQVFLAELTLEELQEVARKVAQSRTNKLIIFKILNGDLISPEEVEAIKARIEQDFLKTGKKQFLKILKGEMEGEKLDVFTNIAGKQKDWSALTDIYKQLLATGDPRAAKLLDRILDISGLSPLDLGEIPSINPPTNSLKGQFINQLEKQLKPNAQRIGQSVS